MSAAATSRFSTGLQFSRKDLHELSTTGNSEGSKISGGGLPFSSLPAPPPPSAEEQLMRSAAALLRNITEELQPRLDAADDGLRNVHREMATLRAKLPSPLFSVFQTKCKLLRHQLMLFEEITVQQLLKDAVESAVVMSSCGAAHAARWRKSNQWPALTNFVELQLYLCFSGSSDEQDGRGGSNTTSNDSSNANTVAATTAVVQRQLALLWRQWEKVQLRSSFLQRFYLLKDVLCGWAKEWRLLLLCTHHGCKEQTKEQRNLSGLCDSSFASSCPGEAWDSLSSLQQLLSFDALCSAHLTEPVVASLERSLSSEFADVWNVVNSTL